MIFNGKKFSEIFLIEVGSFTTLTLFLIELEYVVEIYSKLKGGSCLIKINLHLVKSNFCFFNILKTFFYNQIL